MIYEGTLNELLIKENARTPTILLLRILKREAFVCSMHAAYAYMYT
jgi:hypothetical protein